MQLRKKLFAILLAVTLLVTLCATAYAAEPAGAITVTVEYNHKPVSGGTLTLYQVGEIQNNAYVLTGDFADCGLELDTLDAELALDLARYAYQNGLDGVTETIGRDGTVTFENLELGLYLIVQYQAASGYKLISPFLVTVTEDGEVVDASPKLEIEKKPTTPSKPDTTKPDPVSPWEPDEPVDPVEPEAPADSELPQTGQLNWPVPVLVVLGLALISAGWLMRFKKKRGYEE